MEKNVGNTRGDGDMEVVSKHTCVICATTYARKDHLVRHMQAIHGNNTFPCTICTSIFNRRDNLAVHMKDQHQVIHQKAKFQCPNCPIVCARKDTLVRHMKFHGEKPAFETSRSFNFSYCMA